MFSLIITIISIALVAVLALATLYYGGDAFNRGSAGAEASRLINEGQQVNAAVTMAAVDNVTLTDIAALVSGGYLSQAPGRFLATDLVTGADVTNHSAVVTNDVCVEVQKRAGDVDGADADTTFGIADISTSKQTGQVYGCFNDATNGPTFFYNI